MRARRRERPAGSAGRPLRRTRVAMSFIVSWGLFGGLLGAYWLTTDGEHFQVRIMTVLTGSMRPTLGVGDVFLSEVVPAREIEAGDIVTYREPTGERYVTHRVQSVLWTGTLGHVITRGDANEIGETWTVESDGRIGRVALHLPYLGYAVGALGTTAGRLTITGVAVIIGVYALLLIWRPRREDISASVLQQLQTLDQIAELQRLKGDEGAAQPEDDAQADDAAPTPVVTPQPVA